MTRIYLKILIPSVITILLFILSIFLIIIPRFQQNIMNGKREMIKELTNSAWSILSKYESDERNGLLSREEAQQTAVSRIQYLRYGDENKDYFWITDMVPTMIMHPYRTDLNGKNLTSFSDPHGKRLFVECVETVKKSQQGYVDYMWQWKEDSLHIVPKLSYVKGFKPWGWVIGTGVYIEDVKKEIKALTAKLIWISTGISVLIALLLLFISQQSLKTERKRMAAENELHESKEKYRTLVEAATEGLIMIIDGKISFANKVFCTMTGFGNTELINLALPEIISENNNGDVAAVLSGSNIREGQYEINLKKKNGGFIEVIGTSSTAVLNGKPVNILIVKNITVSGESQQLKPDYQKLISMLDVGFFRTTLDDRGKLMFASETALRILGFTHFNDLSETNILKLLADKEDRKTLKKNLLENGFLKNKVIKIQRKNSETAFVSVTLVVYNDENTNLQLCDGIIEDITLSEQEKTANAGLITGLKSASFLIDQPVKAYVSPTNTLDADSNIGAVVKTMSKSDNDYVLLTRNDNGFLGIITGSDIRSRVLQLNLHIENPAYLIMSSPITSISENSTVSQALNIFDQKNIGYLPLRNEAGEITGVLKANELYAELKKSLSFYIASVNNAETDEELRLCYNSLQLLVKPLIQSDISVKHITNITSGFSDSVIQRLIQLNIQEIGPPPVGFSFICLGSEGRQEETLYTDQDNAIIYDDVPAGKEQVVNAYFLRLGEKVCHSLNHIGYAFCKGNIMASNPQWCKPISTWENYFTRWMLTPEPQNLLDATIFFDFRQVYGDEAHTERLRKVISNQLENRSLLLYHLAHNAVNTKVPHVSSGTIMSDKNTELFDLKMAVNLVAMIARTYALKDNIRSTNTLDRLSALKTRNSLNETALNELLFAYNFLMKLRLKNQVNLSDNKLPLSNSMNTRELLDVEITILKKVLSLIQVYQNSMSADFRITA